MDLCCCMLPPPSNDVGSSHIPTVDDNPKVNQEILTNLRTACPNLEWVTPKTYVTSCICLESDWSEISWNFVLTWSRVDRGAWRWAHKLGSIRGEIPGNWRVSQEPKMENELRNLPTSSPKTRLIKTSRDDVAEQDYTNNSDERWWDLHPFERLKELW